MKSSIDNYILNIDSNIYKNIDKNKDDRGFLSQNILNELRNLVEHIALKIYNKNNNDNLTNEYQNLKKAVEYIKGISQLKFLHNFHSSLQISVSHYTLSEENSERLMLKYYEYLIRIKKLMKEEYNLHILQNSNNFPLNLDNLKQKYYKIIANALEKHVNISNITNGNGNLYYISNIKPFFVDENVYYEVSFMIASDNISKFDKILAFTKLDIMSNYATRLYIIDTHIHFLNRYFPIKIITDWHIDIRPCEITNFCKIIKLPIKDIVRTELYGKFMKYLTQQRLTLIELIEFDDDMYKQIKQNFSKDRLTLFFDCLDRCRQINEQQLMGVNILRYLLYSLNNKIIKQQLCSEQNDRLSKLYLKYGSIPFDDMPFASSPVGHNPRLHDLLKCIKMDSRKHELLAKQITNNAEIEGNLYSMVSDLKLPKDKNLDDLIKVYNNKLYYKHRPNREIHKLGKNIIYIKEYENDILNIINKIKKFTQTGIPNYQHDINIWLESMDIDCQCKKDFLSNLFISSKVALIYGSAGTGKTTMIGHISNFFKDKNKLYLANTNTALTNLRLRLKMGNIEFSTVASFIKSALKPHDVLFIDECSTISNSDMTQILEKTSCEILVCVGDTFQIESIRFGNWFTLIKRFIGNNASSAVVELTIPYRTQDKKLIDLWNSVRNLEYNISEKLAYGNYSASLDQFDFGKNNMNNDKIILCLNYGGIYGINNVNRVLQENNNNEPFIFKDLVYKKGDPILFNEAKRFTDEIHNNVKGKIVNIELLEQNSLKFTVEVDKTLTLEKHSFKILERKDNKTIISFDITNYDTDSDDDGYNIMPFQVAYALSIHKAQGLEYDYVDIIISNDIEEQITHNIFYTAITRARKDLKIFWSPETQTKVLKSMNIRDMRRDYNIIKNKLSQQ